LISSVIEDEPRRAVSLALRQFRSERLWERRATAYDDLIRAASRLCSFHGDYSASLNQGYQISKEWEQRQESKIQEATAILETQFTLATVIENLQSELDFRAELP
jgi:hypothetical protein